jgi:hypothetical protein
MKLKLALSLVAIALQALHLRAQSDISAIAVHEWGTFTSLQGSDGKPLPWKPLQTSQLPTFVHSWPKPGLPLYPASPLLFVGKGALLTYQRMETPVVYFYSERELAMDLTVEFPKGMITEWYPQATQIGPSFVNTNLTSAQSPNTGQTTNSVIHWSNLWLTPARGVTNDVGFPSDISGSHYFTARQTDSDIVRWSQAPESSYAERDKFLFYRGAGNFATPLTVSMKSDNSVVVSNRGSLPLSHLFILGIKSKAGNFAYIPDLQPGEQKTITLNSQSAPLDPEHLSKEISHDMSWALVKSGLYQREADAMVATWHDSWFAEDGVRVLYVLPQAWTEQTLPMTLKPAAKELVRVMVGRAEVLTPGLEKSLVLELQKAKHGDTAASDQARASLKNLGRFAEPAFLRALATSDIPPQEQFQMYGILNDVRVAGQ